MTFTIKSGQEQVSQRLLSAIAVETTILHPVSGISDSDAVIQGEVPRMGAQYETVGSQPFPGRACRRLSENGNTQLSQCLLNTEAELSQLRTPTPGMASLSQNKGFPRPEDKGPKFITVGPRVQGPSPWSSSSPLSHWFLDLWSERNYSKTRWKPLNLTRFSKTQKNKIRC